ncbi:UDP-N-acetylmuramoyl-tripeptide--D-alanyl-D-alanine ligase MurF [Planctomycetes bacterium Poly30]|uniref:UDP-N-acetylmuramoyl-tripeptide--D-alanyl-D-alanine ligase n=1 Tax=Saltatorellus ferox TaxID=2528018 RepID=A0A518EVU6_9BACT|nr:UDP-N-acetylmuramoyl-tripeptide--D-alanyl-D-alanine ligase MurF [Planctomycetes bacterium Poly30]
MIEFSLAEIFQASKVTWQSSVARPEVLARGVTDVSTDTRELRPGSLFIGLPGPRFNGADFARAALDAGASAVLVEAAEPRVRAELERLSEEFVAPVAVCPDARAALAAAGRIVRASLAGRTLGITGSCGKTSTKAIVAHMLRAGVQDADRQDATVVASPKSFNNYVGVPRTLLLCDRETRFAVLEIGTNAPGEIADLADIARPDVALITIIGRAHLERLGSLEGVAREKGALLEALDPAREGSAAVLNDDCPMTPALRQRVPAGVPILTFGCGTDSSGNKGPHSARASVHADGVRATARGTEFELFIDPALTPGRFISGRHVVIPLLGAHAASNVTASLAAVLALGGDLEAALDSIGTLVAEPHRLQPTLAGGVLVIDDAYNANPESMGAAFRTLMAVERGLAPAASGAGVMHRAPERVLVLGAMGEMGEAREALHREVGGLAGACGIDRLYLTGDRGDREALEAYREGALAAGLPSERIRLDLFLKSTVEALTAAGSGLASGDICLVKASRAAGLDRIAEAVARHFSQDALVPELSPPVTSRRRNSDGCSGARA